MTTATKANELWICALPFVSGAGVAAYGTRYRGNDPRVLANPSAFVPFGTPKAEWPTVVDQMIEANKERAEVEAEARAREHRAAAEQNRIKPAPSLFRATRDLETDYEGRPAIIEKGSVVVDGDPLLASFPENFGPVK
jgi:hypothetical protein